MVATTNDSELKKLKKSKKKRKSVDESPERKVKKRKKDKKDKKVKKHKSSKHQPEMAASSTKTDSPNQHYTPHADTMALTEAEIAAFREKSNIQVDGDIEAAIARPILKFNASGLPQTLLQYCNKFEKPSPIQAQCWPLVLARRDVIGVAATGSGKTVAFGLPGLAHLMQHHPSVTPRQPKMLVVAPTRELAQQIAQVFTECGNLTTPKLHTVAIYGGVPKWEQKKKLNSGVHVVVATPGRLLDLMDEEALSLSNVSFCVLDEADRMLDMGFAPDIKRIMTAVNKERQTLMFSATWPEEVQKLGRSYLQNPVQVTVGSKDLAASSTVEQHIHVIEPRDKNWQLLKLLREYHKSDSNKILIFALYKKECQRVADYLQAKRFNVEAIHGDLSQGQRQQVLQNFKHGQVPIVVATDVAARGLDVKDIQVVINYTFPLTIEDYVHRIGRTGRAGTSGISHTLFTAQDKQHAGALGNILRQAGLEIPQDLMKFGMHTKRKSHPVYGDHYRTTDDLVGKTSTKIVFDDSDSD